MDIFNHFSCHTKLPVLLEHVIEHITDMGVVASIEYFPLDMDPTILCGFCWVFTDKPPYASGGYRRARIGYSDRLTREEARLVICKELLHLLDNGDANAQTEEQVSNLVQEIVLPPIAAGLAPQTWTDRLGVLLALAVMLPRDAIDELRPKLDAGVISHETIAKHARLPESWVRVAFSPLWPPMLAMFDEMFKNKGDAELDLRGGISGPPPPFNGADN